MTQTLTHPRLDLPRIRKTLRTVQARFGEINDRLTVRREHLDDTVLANMLSAYEYVDFLLRHEREPFRKGSYPAMLELNHLVLCGPPLPEQRNQFAGHLKMTEDRFYDLVEPLHRWYAKHTKKGDGATKIAAEMYVGVVSRPQLYFEGNHRTGALLASWILLRDGQAPFVLTPENAEAYFNPSSEIKLTDKRRVGARLKLPKFKKRFQRFLEEHISPAHLLT